MSVKITGLNSLKVELKDVLDEVIEQIGDELIWAAEEIEGRAKEYANEHKNKGFLMNSIKSDITNPLETSVSVAAFYGPFIEFGTGPQFNAGERAEYASQFKGREKRPFAEMVKNIMQWLKDKKYYPATVKTEKQRENYARFVAIRILKNGIKARPFLFRAYDEVRPELITNLENILQ